MKAHFLKLTLAALIVEVVSLDNMKCQSGPYPYCVHVQGDRAPDGGAWPVAIFLPGSGARGNIGNAEEVALYDGHGKVISQYYWNSKGQAQKLAAEQFLTVIPIAPEGSRHFDPEKVFAVYNEVKANYNIDVDRVSCSGFSMGARGTWRFGVHHPEILAALAPSAGPAEASYMDTLQQEYATPTFNLLKNIININVKHFAGSADTTAGTSEQQKTQDEIVKDGGKKSQFVILQGADHSAMSTRPWSDTDLFSWLLLQKRSGSSSQATTSSTRTRTATASPARTETAGSKPTSTSAATEAVDDEDCEDEEPEEEDCEEEEPQTEEEDCEDEEDEKAKRDSVPVIMERQSHHFVFSHSRRDVLGVQGSPAVAQRQMPASHRRNVRSKWHGRRMIPTLKRRLS